MSFVITNQPRVHAWCVTTTVMPFESVTSASNSSATSGSSTAQQVSTGRMRPDTDTESIATAARDFGSSGSGGVTLREAGGATSTAGSRVGMAESKWKESSSGGRTSASGVPGCAPTPRRIVAAGEGAGVSTGVLDISSGRSDGLTGNDT